MKTRKEQNRKGWVQIKVGTVIPSLTDARIQQVIVRAERGEPAAGRRLFLSYLPRISAELRAAELRGGRLLEAIQILEDEFVANPRKWQNIFNRKIKINICSDRGLTGTGVIPGNNISRQKKTENHFVFLLVRADKKV